MVGRKRELGVITNAVKKPGESAGVAITGPWGSAKVGWRERRLPGAGGFR